MTPLWKSCKEISEKPTEPDDILTLGDIGGKLYLQTKLMPSINIHENNSAAALEIMSRFAADPHWLIYLFDRLITIFVKKRQTFFV